MQQLIQSYKTGELGLFEVPCPVCDPNGLLIATTASLVSAGTEKMIVDIAKKSLLGKAKARPDLVKQVIDKMKQEGVKNTLEKVFNKLDTPIPLGYSCAGRVIQVGEQVDGFSVGDRVACGGAGYANHSEINYVPKNICVKIPDGVDDPEASFVTVGAIALQGVRQAEPTLGERVAVIGLGLIGQLTVQLLKANGCKVLGSDLDSDKLALAEKLGADSVCSAGDLIPMASAFSNGHGVDSVIITASTSSNQPIIDAGEIARLRGKVVVVGMVGMDVPRNSYYRKELDLRLSMAYGPGRYDPQYEEKGIDYPYSYVRWTEQRNFEAFLGLVAEGKVTPKELVTHQFDFDDALKAYDLLEGKIKEKYLGIVLNYPNADAYLESAQAGNLSRVVRLNNQHRPGLSSEDISYGLIGAGNFTKSVILPNLSKVGGFDPVALCTATGVSAHSVGTKHGFDEITTDSEAIFANPRVNTVLITTRHNTHADYVLRALKAGKHVFVEKPLCINQAELDEIEQGYRFMLADGKAPVLTVGFNRRFAPLISKMKEAVGEQPLAVTYRINAGVIPRDVWIQDPEVGGGRIVGEVCHFVDTCSFLAGSNPISAYATCVRKADTSIPDEDNVSILLNFANGSTAAIHYLAYGSRQVPKEWIELSTGSKTMQLNDFRELVIFDGSCKEKHKGANQDKGFQAEFIAFREGVRSGIAPIPFDSICATTRTTFAVLESLRSGQPVTVG
ncbi:putative dehydrogenase [Geothermobacter ehrlichii]|uniref:Putative dehydrogenase n=1 Tax=Geothermobacter ehrlichii TaxID=213224 RepID=A0A5D3WJB0_9BACT|nr:bi-domain-containing oxidoreductase [Geothermobacter ehrlichii]TYO98351.1 putative dehydrogenase [Geothermobacter ehrlichii]